MSISQKVFALAALKNLNDNQLHHVTGISSGLISEWRSGKKEPGIRSLVKIADCLNVPLSYFIDTKNKRTSTGAEENNSEFERAFFRLRKGLDPADFTEQDADFLLTVYKAHKEKNK